MKENEDRMMQELESSKLNMNKLIEESIFDKKLIDKLKTAIIDLDKKLSKKQRKIEK